MYFNIRIFRYFDWIQSTLIFLLGIIGLISIFSATYSAELPYSIFFKKQCIGLAIGFLIYFICALCDYRLFMYWGYVLYIGIIALLFFTLIKGSVGMGGQRWINLFFFKIQPSELAKLFFPPFFSYHLYLHKNDPVSRKLFMPLVSVLAISCPLIMKQPDLGTSLIILFSGLILLWLANIGKQFFIILTLSCFIFSPVFWLLLRDYQKKRITVFLGAGKSHKERYQIEQSIIAIGSGGLCGKGLFKGTQNKLHFLPEGRTDFIFSVIAEELGLVGALSIILLYCLLIIHLFIAILSLSNYYAQILATGLCIHIFLSSIINIGMVMNMLPVVGIPLPLISYGLCNLWINLASLGFVHSIIMHEQTA